MIKKSIQSKFAINRKEPLDFWLAFDYAIFKIVNQKSEIVNQFALGIEALRLPLRINSSFFEAFLALKKIVTKSPTRRVTPKTTIYKLLFLLELNQTI